MLTYIMYVLYVFVKYIEYGFDIKLLGGILFEVDGSSSSRELSFHLLSFFLADVLSHYERSSFDLGLSVGQTDVQEVLDDLDYGDFGVSSDSGYLDGELGLFFSGRSGTGGRASHHHSRSGSGRNTKG